MVYWKTSKVEYKEAVAKGIIEEMAEFQDGSAFVWRSQQIFATIENEVDPIDSSRINELYAEVWNGYDTTADPVDVNNLVDAIIYEYEELSGITSDVSPHEEEVFGEAEETVEETTEETTQETEYSGLAPVKQLKEGVEPQKVQCKSGMEIVFKPSGQPACVKSTSVQKLVNLGWTQ